MSAQKANELSASQASASPPASAPGVWLSLLVALGAVAGSLWLSIGMSLKACPLCFYQRSFVMGVVAVLAVGLLTGVRPRAVLSVLALPLAVAGFGVAVFHVYLELTGKLECPGGVLGVGTAPQQSLAILSILLVVVGASSVRDRATNESRPVAVIAAALIGVLLAGASIVSAPPLPKPPTTPYTTPLDICRPPYVK